VQLVGKMAIGRLLVIFTETTCRAPKYQVNSVALFARERKVPIVLENLISNQKKKHANHEFLGCTHFTWTRYDGGTCWMKKGAVSKSDAFDTDDRSSVCGVVNSGGEPNPIQGFVSYNTVDFKIKTFLLKSL
jgi:hypothetical protein